MNDHHFLNHYVNVAVPRDGKQSIFNETAFHSLNHYYFSVQAALLSFSLTA